MSPVQELLDLYFNVLDDAVGKVLENTRRNDLILALSGHGFGPFKKLVNINGFLGERGRFLSVETIVKGAF